MSLCVLVFAQLVSAAGLLQPDVNITVMPGAGDYVQGDTQTPVFVILENNDVDRKGRVEASLSGIGTGAQAVASRELDLPPDSRKGVFLYLPIPQQPTGLIRVRYRNEGGGAVATVEQRLKSVTANTRIVCGISGLPPKLPPEQSPSGATLYQRLYLQLDQIPDRHQGLEMFDAIIMSPTPRTPLPASRATALRDWVLRGGSLVVDASERSDVFLQGLFPKMLPFVPQGTEEATLSLFGKSTPFARGTVQRGEVLLESDDHPLVVRTPMGLGSVTCFAIAPNAPVFTTWDGGPAIWREVLDSIFTDDPRRRTLDAVQKRKEALRSLVQEPQRVGLRLGLVLLLTAIYALAVGPGDYLLVKWLKRPKLTWITFPTMVAVFTIASYAGAKAWVGGEMASACARRLLILPQEHVALQYDVVSLFAPGGRDYHLRHEDGAIPYNIRSMAFDDAALRLNQDDDSLIQRIPIWQSRVFGCDVTRTEYPDIDVVLSRKDGALVATITNNSDMKLTRGAVHYGLESWRLGNGTLGPGATKSVTLTGKSTGDLLAWAALTQIGGKENDAWPHGRQFDVRRALGRGGVFVRFDSATRTQNPLIVDDAPRSETGSQFVQILTYEEAS
ncbi:MAG: hypothetical protein GY851_05540 [bacterium]|nr:hypothetical protein [bacterium]